MTIAALIGSRPWLLAGWTMLHFFWVGGLIGLLGAALRRAMRGARPELRYGVALLGLAALAVAPAPIALRIAGIPRRAPIDSTPWQQKQSSPIEFMTDSSESTRPRISVPSPSSVGPAPMTDRAAPEDILSTAATGLPGLWLLGAPATFLLLATGLIGAERLRRQSRPLADGDLTDRCRRLAATLGLARPVAIGVCDRLMTPVLLGVVRPMILLPTFALTGWSTDQIEMALLHELAHVRRLDNLVNLLQRTIEALLFFHPAVWWVSGWIRLEREHCCDRIVIAHTGHPRPYAELLASLAMPNAPRGRAAVAMAEAPIVERIRRIFNLEDQPMRLSHAFVAFVAGLLIAPAALITSQAGPPDQANDQPPAQPNKAADGGLEPLFQRALHGAEMLQEVQGRAYTLAGIAGAQARTGHRDAARRTFTQAVAIAETVGFDDSTYSPHILFLVAQAQAKAGFRDQAIDAMRTLLRIVQAPVKNDYRKVDLFTNMVGAQVALGDEEGMRETLRIGRRFYSTTKEIGIRAFAAQSLVRLQAKSGDLAGALRMIHDPGVFQGEDAENQRHGALFIIVEQIKAGDERAAGPILDEAIQAVNAIEAETPSWGMFQRRNQDLKTIAEAEARLGRFAEATKRARKIQTEDVPDRFAKAARGSSRNIDKFNKATAFACIAEEQAKAGDRDGARQSAEEVGRIVTTISNQAFARTPLGRASQTLATVGDYAGALRLADLMIPYRRTDQYFAVATVQRESRDEAGAQATLEAALRHLRTLLDAPEPDQPDRRPGVAISRDTILRTISLIQATKGDLTGAIETASRIGSGDGLRFAALTNAARARASMNDLDGAMKAVGRIDSPKLKAEALESVLNALPRSVTAESKPVEAAPR